MRYGQTDVLYAQVMRLPLRKGNALPYNSTIDPATILAYLETEYHVRGKTPAILKVGSVCPELLSLHQENQADCSAFITACNPFSQALDEARNAERQRALLHELRQHGRAFAEGIGQHPSNHWPGEESFLIFGLTLADAMQLGKRFEQNAIIWSGTDGIPQLILLR
jgi:hypothetical protein